MNAAIYLFGRLGGDYTQYPDDHTHTLFEEFEQNIQAKSQLMVHRSNSLVYCAYLRRISGQGRYIGIVFVFNGVVCNDVQTLCKLCEDNIAQWVGSGYVLEMDNKGRIVSKIDQLYHIESDLEIITNSLKGQLTTANLTFTDLPPVNFSVSEDSVKKLRIEDGNNAFTEALKSYANIYVYNGQTSAALATYSETLKNLNIENKQLKSENAKVKRQKKNINIVLVLSFVLFLGIIIIGYYVNSSSQQQKTIDRLDNQLVQRKLYIGSLKNDSVKMIKMQQSLHAEIDKCQTSIKQLQNDSMQKESDIVNLRRELSGAKDKINSFRRQVQGRDETISQLNNRIRSLQNSIGQKDSEILSQRQTINEKDSEISELRNSISKSINEARTTKSKKNKASSETPAIAVKSIEFASCNSLKNYNSKFGERISSRNCNYVCAKLIFQSSISGDQTIWFNLMGPNGQFSQCHRDTIKRGKNYVASVFLGNGSNFPSGKYTIAIVVDGKMVGSENFSIE